MANHELVRMRGMAYFVGQNRMRSVLRTVACRARRTWLEILGMSPDDVRCAYCGDKSSEWDHLRPLVVGRRPTGYISEISNLVPSCGKCNQSMGNKKWEVWMMSEAPHAPARRKIPSLAERIERLKAFEKRRDVCPISFEEIIGPEDYAHYWKRLDEITQSMRQCQEIANRLKRRICERRLRDV